jgi:hypothetical protein
MNSALPMRMVRMAKPFYGKCIQAEGVTDILMPKPAFLAIYEKGLKKAVTLRGLNSLIATGLGKKVDGKIALLKPDPLSSGLQGFTMSRMSLPIYENTRCGRGIVGQIELRDKTRISRAIDA